MEIGLGGNVSLWGGLATAGFGYNLSRSEDGEYVFVGVGLLEALDRVKSSGIVPWSGQ